MKLVARHNISSGPKGKRQTIVAGQQFDTADYPDVMKDEWDAMMKNGNVLLPDAPDYASPAMMQTAAAPEPEPEPEPQPGRRSRRHAEPDDDV